jgi:hypothetical protein
MNGLPPIGPSQGAQGVSPGGGIAGPRVEIKHVKGFWLGETKVFQIDTDSKNPSCQWAIYNNEGKDITQSLLKSQEKILGISQDGKEINFRPTDLHPYTIRAWVTDDRGSTHRSLRMLASYHGW